MAKRINPEKCRTVEHTKQVMTSNICYLSYNEGVDEVCLLSTHVVSIWGCLEMGILDE